MVISTIKDSGLRSNKLLLVRRASPDGKTTGDVFVALDTVGAGEDELVLVVLGSSARESQKTRGAPVDAAIVGIIDSTAGQGTPLYRKGIDGLKTEHQPRKR
jgi:ethanolamine utilization protein EutN